MVIDTFIIIVNTEMTGAWHFDWDIYGMNMDMDQWCHSKL